VAHAQPAPRRPSPAAEDRRHDLVVIGASAGGVEALLDLVRDLPADFQAPVLVVLHVLSSGTSVLPQLLDRAGPLPAESARDDQELASGRIYVAPPDHHLVVQPGRLELSRGPRENGHRPAVDVLFRSAAWAYGSRVVGVILSGARDDGASGLRHVKSLGGLAIVQDPQEALYPGMPRSAVKAVAVDWIAPLKGIAPLLTRLVREGRPAPAALAGSAEPAPAPLDDPGGTGDDATGLTCPDCGGALWQVHEGSLVRLQCRVGHTFSPESLLASQADSLESALWAALRTLEERAELLARMSARARQRREDSAAADRFEVQARDAEARAGLIREAIMQAPEANEAAVSEPEEVATEPSGNGAGST
jgi:two-component system, chemotaxis family, protein-glutamate methylesterase/glutaminase